LNANASPPGTGSAQGLLSQKFNKNFPSSTTINALVPFKNNYYNSLQTKVTQRFAQGSSYGFAWTWSKAINYEDNEDLSSLSFPYPAFWDKNRSLASFDRTHNVEIWGVLAVPFGEGQRWFQSGPGKYILGGWLVNPIISRMSGIPFTVGAGGNLNANGSNQTADQVGYFRILKGKPPRTGVTCTHDNPSCHYFDPNVFAAPLITSAATAHYGNTRRNEFRGPGYFNMNLSLARQFKLTERFGLQFRADAMSFTNTPHFNNPNATVGAANFGVITSTLKPPGQGFFGNDPGNRILWLGARLTF
jgi:hypothetical protein